MKKILIVATHPDDETLGCSGAIQWHKKNGDEVYWVIATEMKKSEGWSNQKISNRKIEIDSVANEYNFNKIFNFHLPTTKLETLPYSEIIENIVQVYKEISPDIIYVPYSSDVHTDHQIIAKAFQSTFKSFRYSHVQKILVYETLSETEVNFSEEKKFNPNYFINISNYIDEKIRIMSIYKSEFGEHPFPRSEKTIRALASLRGSQSGFEAAEAFMLIYQKVE